MDELIDTPRIVELVNPSDRVTFLVTDETAAGVAVLLLGQGSYGLKDPESGKMVVPIMLMGAHARWLQERDITNLDEYVLQHAIEIATFLESYVYGNHADRLLFDNAIDMMNEAQLRTFKRFWDDARRSSMNDIGSACTQIAQSLRQMLSNAKAADEKKTLRPGQELLKRIEGDYK